ncbi:MAG: CinA family protein [Candidatus Omnitrophota bacterium]
MENVIKETHRLLIKKRKTVSTAESCTGGLLAKLLTDIPGSSSYFILGLVTYSNKTKEAFLTIPHSLILKNGAVSKEVAEALAIGVRKKIKTDFGIGITGIAGPTGQTQTKSIGTVFICVAMKNKKLSKKFIFRGNRLEVRHKAALEAIKLLKSLL